jgi:hypothetical protein
VWWILQGGPCESVELSDGYIVNQQGKEGGRSSFADKMQDWDEDEDEEDNYRNDRHLGIERGTTHTLCLRTV